VLQLRTGSSSEPQRFSDIREAVIGFMRTCAEQLGRADETLLDPVG
jgi:hypothetical protein